MATHVHAVLPHEHISTTHISHLEHLGTDSDTHEAQNEIRGRDPPEDKSDTWLKEDTCHLLRGLHRTSGLAEAMHRLLCLLCSPPNNVLLEVWCMMCSCGN